MSPQPAAVPFSVDRTEKSLNECPTPALTPIFGAGEKPALTSNDEPTDPLPRPFALSPTGMLAPTEKPRLGSKRPPKECCRSTPTGRSASPDTFEAAEPDAAGNETCANVGVTPKDSWSPSASL